MAEPFDPYYKWLGIPPDEQPPHFYRLLGLRLFEDNHEVIEHAADRQMAHVRSLQIGQRFRWTQQLLNELAAARVCLLSPQSKAAYDAQLQQRRAIQAAAGPQVSEAGRSVGGVADAEAGGASAGPLAAYVFLERLAETRSGELFKVQHRTMNRIAAVKLLGPDAMQQPEAVARFHRTVQILARQSHPNLVAAYEAGLYQGRHFLIMEYVEGGDLSTLLRQQGRLDVQRALHYMAQAARGLGHLHGQGIVHRNVKPANLLVDRHDVVKVVGLGLARVAPGSELSGGNELTQAGQHMGTPAFMSPEQALDSNRVDPRADIYSLGCTLYAALALSAPYADRPRQQQVEAHRTAPIPSLRAVRPEVPEGLDRVFQRMLAKRPEDRFESMEEVLEALIPHGG